MLTAAVQSSDRCSCYPGWGDAGCNVPVAGLANGVTANISLPPLTWKYFSIAVSGWWLHPAQCILEVRCCLDCPASTGGCADVCSMGGRDAMCKGRFPTALGLYQAYAPRSLPGCRKSRSGKQRQG